MSKEYEIYSKEMEKALLGSILLNGRGALNYLSYISPEDLYEPRHRIIFRYMIQLEEENSDGSRKEPVDIKILHEKIGNDELKKIGGVAYLVELQEDIPTYSLIDGCLETIKRYSLIRKTRDIGEKILKRCNNYKKEKPEEILEDLQKDAAEILNQQTTSDCLNSTQLIQKNIQPILEEPTSKNVIPTYIESIDDVLQGFARQDMVVLAARPSMGKTALALNIAFNMAKEGHKIAFFSYEMDDRQLTKRLISSESGIPYSEINHEAMHGNDELQQAVINKGAEIGKFDNFCIHKPKNESMYKLKADIRAEKRRRGLDVVFIDYLHLFGKDIKAENENIRISKMSRELKQLAQELDICLVVLSQLSRALDARTDKRPILSDLRSSGAIEQDADVVAFLYRDVVYNQNAEDPTLAEFNVAKYRNGRTGKAELTFIGQCLRFE